MNIDPPLVKKHQDTNPMKTIVKEDMSNLGDWLIEFNQWLEAIEKELFLDLGFENLTTEQANEIKEFIEKSEFASFDESKKIITESFPHLASKR